jgi:Domain of unknown function (DUF4190)
MPPAEPQQPPPNMTAWQRQNLGYTQQKTELSHKAIWSLVLALIGLVLGLIFPIAAIVVGILALRDTKDNPRLKGEGLAIAGLAVGALGLVAHIALMFS